LVAAVQLFPTIPRQQCFGEILFLLTVECRETNILSFAGHFLGAQERTRNRWLLHHCSKENNF